MVSSKYITHVIKIGDSLQRIAASYNIPDWRDLVRLNNLVYPYIQDTLRVDDSDTPVGVLRVGDRMLIPIKDSNLSSNNIDIYKDLSIDNVEKYAYGCDLDLYNYNSKEQIKNSESKGELSDYVGDLKLSEGVVNLRQRILTRLSVPKGSMILHPEFGSNIGRYIGLKGTSQNIIKLTLAVQESILEDELIERVQNLKVEKNGVALIIDCKVIPIPPYSPFKLSEELTILQ